VTALALHQNRERGFSPLYRPVKRVVKISAPPPGRESIPASRIRSRVSEPVQRQFRLQSADNVELRDRLAPAFAGALPDPFQRHRVRLWVAHPLAERA
jgi:hypothetical protein